MATFNIDDVEWHVDHIIPKVWYQYAFVDGKLHQVELHEQDFMRCWHCMNLQALSAPENMSKSINLPSDEMLLILKPWWPIHWKDIPSPQYRFAVWERVKGKKVLEC